jgi:hypothetical protein
MRPWDRSGFFSEVDGHLPRAYTLVSMPDGRFTVESPAGFARGEVVCERDGVVSVKLEVDRKLRGSKTNHYEHLKHPEGAEKALATVVQMLLGARSNPMTIGRLADLRQRQAEAALGRSLSLTWDIGPYAHFRTKRGFGVTFHSHRNPNWGTCHIRLAEKLVASPQHRQDGIIQHELGHVIDLQCPPGALDAWASARGVQLPPQKQGEIRADAIAHAIWGKPLRYDTDTVQSTRHGSPFRPPHLGL